MFRSCHFLFILLFIITLKVALFARVPVSVAQFEGNGSIVSESEAKVKEILSKTGGISVIADRMMKDIVKAHEKAQIVGSSKIDASNLKVAEYIITGSVSGGKLSLKAVDVNQGTEVYNQTIDISGDNGKRLLAKSVKEMSDKILLQSSSKGDEVPAEAKPYMDVINRLLGSLSGSEESSYSFIAIYLKGAYKHPDSDDSKSVESAKRQLKFMKQDLLRAKLFFLNMKTESFWIYIDVVAEKGGRKTKFRFGLLELDDGSIGVAKYEEVK